MAAVSNIAALNSMPVNPKKAKEKLDFLLSTALSKIDELQALIKKESLITGQDVSQPLIPILRRQEDIMSNVYKLKLPGANVAAGGVSTSSSQNNISVQLSKEGVKDHLMLGNSGGTRRYNQNLQAGQFGGSLPRRGRTKEPHLRADQRYAGEFVLGLPERKEKIVNFHHPTHPHSQLPNFQPPPPRQSMISSFPPPQSAPSFQPPPPPPQQTKSGFPQNHQPALNFIPSHIHSAVPPFPSPQTQSTLSMFPSSQSQTVIPPFSSPQSQIANDSQWSFVTARESLSQSTFFDAATSFADESHSQLSESSDLPPGPPLPLMKADSKHLNVNETTKPFRMEDVMKYSTKYRGIINTSPVESWSKQNESFVHRNDVSPKSKHTMVDSGDNRNANYQHTPELPPRLPRKQKGDSRGHLHFPKEETDDAAWVHDMPTIV